MSETNHPSEPPVEQPSGTRAPARTGRGLRIALAISVALNLAVAGVVVGVAVHGGPGGRGEMVREMGFGPFEGALRPEDRDALRQTLRDRFGDIRAARRQMQQDGQAILSALRADPFDPESLTEAMATQADHLAERLRFGSEVLRNHLLSLSDEDRGAFADRMEGRMRGGPEGGEHDDGDDKDKDKD